MRHSLRAILAGVSLFLVAATGLQGQSGRISVPALPASLKLSAAAAAATTLPVADLPAPDVLIRAARMYLGVPYVHGGDSRQGMDCSGLVYRVYHDILGMNLPRGVDGLFRAGVAASSPLHVGDLVFFDTDDDGKVSVASHVGVYAGGRNFVHAASEGSRTGVIVSSLDFPYYRERFLGARRVFPWRAPVLSMTVTDDHQSLSETSPFASREPLTIQVINGMTGGGPLDLTVLKDGRQVISRRVVPGAQKPAVVDLVPDVGTWTVRINRIFKGRELEAVTFVVEE